jgi:hypothetical protein
MGEFPNDYPWLGRLGVQYTNSSEKTWNESTPDGMPLAGTYA